MRESRSGGGGAAASPTWHMLPVPLRSWRFCQRVKVVYVEVVREACRQLLLGPKMSTMSPEVVLSMRTEEHLPLHPAAERARSVLCRIWLANQTPRRNKISAIAIARSIVQSIPRINGYVLRGANFNRQLYNCTTPSSSCFIPQIWRPRGIWPIV